MRHVQIPMKKIKALVLQFFKFGLVGVSNTLLSLAASYLLMWLGVHYFIANVVGFVVGVVNSFFWNRRFVFKQSTETNNAKMFLRLTISYGGSFFISMGLSTLLVEYAGVSQWLAPVLRLVVTVPLNFIVNKVWAFKEKW